MPAGADTPTPNDEGVNIDSAFIVLVSKLTDCIGPTGVFIDPGLTAPVPIGLDGAAGTRCKPAISRLRSGATSGGTTNPVVGSTTESAFFTGPVLPD